MPRCNNRLHMHHDPQIPSLLRRVSISVLLGLFIAAVGSAVEAAIEHHALIAFESIDEIVIGITAALVVFAYEQRRHKAILNKVRVIAAMNHHVRNALQTISYSAYTRQEEQIRLVADSVNRIQWALREILPAEESAPDSLFSHGSAANPAIPPQKERKQDKRGA